MRKALRIFLAMIGLIAFAAATWQVGYSQSDTAESFPTRHTVEGAFLEFYRSIPNPERVYGYPITEAFTNRDGLRVQYFQRARFELQSGHGVMLTPLGSLLYTPNTRPAADFNRSPADCRAFTNGLSVCAAFLEFYDAHGGEAQFGRPISNVELEGIRKVQYFEYARLEWVPEGADLALPVQITQLGRLLFDRLGEDRGLLPGSQLSAAPQVTALQLHAFSGAAVVDGTGPADVFIVAQDQTHAPVAGLELQITIRYPDGHTEMFPAVTGPLGFVEVDVAIGPDLPRAKRITVSAQIDFAGRPHSTQTSFWLGE